MFLFLHFHSPVLTRDHQDNRNYREIKFSTTSFPACSQAETNGWCRTLHAAEATACRRTTPTCVRDCTVCGSHTLSPALTSCDSWLKVGSSGPVVPDQPGETLEIHRDRGNRTWWHPPCHPLSQPAPPVLPFSCQPVAPSLAVIHTKSQLASQIFPSEVWKLSMRSNCTEPILKSHWPALYYHFMW